MVCSEVAPFAKTGGLADVATGLSLALRERAHDVRILLPRYAHLPPDGAATKVIERAPRFRYHEVLEGQALPIYLLELREPAPGPELYSGDESDGLRFLQLAEAALHLGDALEWQPDILHCHDWHAALVPVMRNARSRGNGAPCVLTLHNMGYQGAFSRSVLDRYGASDLFPLAVDPGDSNAVNFLRAGIREADQITTVSPTYAHEIQTPEYGMGLQDALRERASDLTGILNGVDYGTWGAATDPHLPRPYDARDLSPKYELKAALCRRLGLEPDQNAPLIGLVSRLVFQKGIDLLVDALPELIATSRARFALLGVGDPILSARLGTLAAAHPRRLSFTEGFDDALAHQILAGSDIALVPSRYEPCGLTQLYALRYGTIPVVRATGGLADTVQHFNPATDVGNGSVFRDADAGGLLWGTRCALAWYDDSKAWLRLIENAMAADFAWDKQVGQYESVYERVLARSRAMKRSRRRRQRH